MRRKAANCSVCLERPAKGSYLCEPCGRSYDRYAHRYSDVAYALRWAAKRARRYERRRQERKSAPGLAGPKVGYWISGVDD